MKTNVIAQFSLVVVSVMSCAAFAQEPNIDNWQKGHRAEGLVNLHRIATNLIVVNAQNVFPLNYQVRDYAIHEIPSVARVMKHPAVSGFVVITEDGDVLLENYGNGKNRNTTFANMSSTKTIGYLLLNRALRDGKIRLGDKVEKHLPNVGTGFKGRTINDVASMAVHHNLNELAAYKGDAKAKVLYDLEDGVVGHQRNDERVTLSKFITGIGPAGENGSNEWKGQIVNYATINTTVLGLSVARATNALLTDQVRGLMHKVGGENPMYMCTDFDGVAYIGGGFVLSTVDFARYGRLLIEDKQQVLSDRKACKSAGQPTPAEMTHIESRYYKSAIHNEYGIGHSGWGGQLVWADPESGTIVAINSQLMGKLPAPYPHFDMLYETAYDIVKHQRAKKN